MVLVASMRFENNKQRTSCAFFSITGRPLFLRSPTDRKTGLVVVAQTALAIKKLREVRATPKHNGP
jgi:hypothetical protein